MNLTYIRRAHLVFHVKQAMNPSGFLAAEVASVPLHTQYLAGASNMKAALSALVGFQFRHSLPSQVLFRFWAVEQQGIL